MRLLWLGLGAKGPPYASNGIVQQRRPRAKPRETNIAQPIIRRLASVPVLAVLRDKQRHTWVHDPTEARGMPPQFLAGVLGAHKE
jgi:hypothetical protein